MLVILLPFFLAPAVAIGATFGTARIIDGDTIQVAGQRIRLYGIDAPEINQLCQRKGVPWPCGIEAARTLKERIAGSAVSCTENDRDRYGRIVAVCKANSMDINAAMVLSGMALAYRKYSNVYIGHGASAKLARRGLWSGQFIPPWKWRQGNRIASKGPANDTANHCRIKGNISSKGDRIYHMPNSRWYGKTLVTESKGERWFCSENQAIGAGWRRVGASAHTIPAVNSGQ